MDMLEQRALNHAAYDRLKRGLARTYGRGRFVAISGGEVVAESDNFEELRSALTEMGKDPGESLIVQAGIEYLEKAVIFLADWPATQSSLLPSPTTPILRVWRDCRCFA